MNKKKIWEREADENACAPTCTHADELVSYLYGETNAEQASQFEDHMQRCASCLAELAEFRQTRNVIGEWREQALQALAPTATEARLSNIEAGLSNIFDSSHTQTLRQRSLPGQRSRLDALREFFTLAPVWTRAATAFAALLICALAFIAFSNFYALRQPQPQQVAVINQPTTTSVQQPLKVGTTNQMEAGSEATSNDTRRVEVEALSPQKLDQPEVSAPRVAVNTTPARPHVKRSNPLGSGLMAANPASRRETHTITQKEWQELAEVLLQQTASVRDEERLPRLSDLLDDTDDAN